MHNPKVTIVMPNFNKGGFAEIAVNSVLAQSYGEWELLFIDDHSLDASGIFAQNLAANNSKIRFFTTPKMQSGGGVARNIGIRKAIGKYVIFLDSDDWMAPECLVERVNLFEANPTLDFLAFPMAVFWKVPGDKDLITNIPKSESDLDRFLARDQPWLISGPIWKTSFLQRQNGFDTALISQQDADFHIRMMLETDACRYLHVKPNVAYRLETESLSRQNSHSLEGLRQRVHMLENHLTLLRDRNKFTPERKLLIARYLLDIAQMMRWHMQGEPRVASGEGLKIWMIAHREALVSQAEYVLGMAYVRFKHNMFWNHFPKWQSKKEIRYRAKLGDLIFYPSTTLCKAPADFHTHH